MESDGAREPVLFKTKITLLINVLNLVGFINFHIFSRNEAYMW